MNHDKTLKALSRARYCLGRTNVGFDATTGALEAMKEGEDSIVSLRRELDDTKNELRLAGALLLAMFATSAYGAINGVGYDTVPDWLRLSVFAASTMALVTMLVRVTAGRLLKAAQPEE